MRLLASAALLILAGGLLAGCQREIRGHKSEVPTPPDRAAAFDGDAFHIARGRQLYGGMSCGRCHSPGGMGPPLIDDEWRYGGSMAEIAATILDGRPNGMPSFRNRITEDQAWQLAAFVRSLSAQPRRGRP